MSLGGNEAAGLWMPGLVACLAALMKCIGRWPSRWNKDCRLGVRSRATNVFQLHPSFSDACSRFSAISVAAGPSSSPPWSSSGCWFNGFEQSMVLSTRLPTTTRPLCTSAEGRAFAQKVVSERMGRFREMNADDHKQGRRRLGRSLSGNDWSKSEAPA